MIFTPPVALSSALKNWERSDHSRPLAAERGPKCSLPLPPTSSYELGIHEWQLNGLRQQQHRGSEAVKLWAEIWNFTRESWSGIPDFCIKLLCLTASELLLPMTVQLILVHT